MGLKETFGKALDYTLAIGCLVLIGVVTALSALKPELYAKLVPVTIAPAVVFHALVVGNELHNLKP